LPAFLLTSVIDADLATDAANLGVVGFVQKPLADLDEVVERLSQLAHASLARTREHDYLERIKERHERVLARYRALPREQ
jgi:FixJ family two-component response regulator